MQRRRGPDAFWLLVTTTQTAGAGGPAGACRGARAGLRSAWVRCAGPRRCACGDSDSCRPPTPALAAGSCCCICGDAARTDRSAPNYRSSSLKGHDSGMRGATEGRDGPGRGMFAVGLGRGGGDGRLWTGLGGENSEPECSADSP